MGELDAFLPETTVTLANHPFSLTPSVSGVLGELDWKLLAGSLPTGLFVDGLTGSIRGTPEELGTWSGVVLEATDTDGETVEVGPLSLIVQLDGEPIFLATEALTVKPGFFFSTAVPDVLNTIGDYSFRSSQAVQLGLEIDPDTGVISGSLPFHGSRIIDIDVTDSTNRVTSEPQMVNVMPFLRLTVNPYVFGTVNGFFRDLVPITEYAIGNVAYELEGNLPDGLQFNPATGAIVGTPTELGVFGPLRIVGTDSYGDAQKSNDFGMEILDDGSIPTVSVPTIPLLRVGLEMANIVPEHGDKKSGDIFSLNRPLPSGLILDGETGTISGTPLPGAHGIYNGYVMRVTDVKGRYSEDGPFRIEVRDSVNVAFDDVEQTTLPRDTFETYIPVSTGGAPAGPLTFELLSVSPIAPNAIFNPIKGTVSGLVSETTVFTVRPVDGTGPYNAFTIRVEVPTLSIAVGNVNSFEGALVNLSPIVTGATGKTTFTVTPALPSALSFDTSTGLIDGELPALDITYRIEVTDSLGLYGSALFRINAAPLCISGLVDRTSAGSMNANPDEGSCTYTTPQLRGTNGMSVYGLTTMSGSNDGGGRARNTAYNWCRSRHGTVMDYRYTASGRNRKAYPVRSGTTRYRGAMRGSFTVPLSLQSEAI